MERFCLSQTDDRVRERLLDAISGKGAFRRFKDLAFRLVYATRGSSTGPPGLAEHVAGFPRREWHSLHRRRWVAQRQDIGSPLDER